jgi:RNA-directed DNA polymerase
MPSGSNVAQRTAMKPAFRNDLLDAVLQRANLQQAWKQVRTNKGVVGVDGMTIDEFPAWVKAGHWSVVEQSIRSGDYQPAPVRRVEIDKADGGKRQLGIPTVTDRVIQQAIAQILMPLFDPGFSADSYGFRPGRNAHQAVQRVQSILKEGKRFAVDVDLSKFFDRVNHDLLMTHLGRRVRDKRLLALIARYLRAGIIDNQLYLESREGVPQGGLCEALHKPPYVK